MKPVAAYGSLIRALHGDPRYLVLLRKMNLPK
jgi:hypothetical protein